MEEDCMKKCMAYFVVLAMLFCLMGCGSTRNENMEAAGNGNGNTNGVNGQTATETPGNGQEKQNGTNGQTEDGVAGNNQGSLNGTNSQTTDGVAGSDQGNLNGTNSQTTDGVAQEPLGKALASDFKKRMKNKKQMDPMELARKLLKNPAIEFEGTTTEVREGYLTGFRDDIDGFERGVMFAPVISSIPFVGYVFRTEDNEDAEELKWELKEEADPNWNICTEATQTVVKVVGNMVFFVMCP